MNYLFEHGVNFVNHMNWNTPSVDTPARAAYETLIANERPRPGTAGGIGQIRAVAQPDGQGNEKRYNIAAIGTGLNRNGLLKSLNQDASWEGTVYVSPFHAHLTVNEPIALSNMTLATNQFDSGSVARLNAGDRIEIQGLVRRDNTNALFTLLALHDGIELPGHRQHFTVSGAWSHFLYVLRIQNPMDSVQILINSGKRDAASTGQQTAEFEDFSMPVIKESVARVAYNNPTGTPHRGGATFDVLTLDYQPEHATPSPFDYSSTD